MHSPSLFCSSRLWQRHCQRFVPAPLPTLARSRNALQYRSLRRKKRYLVLPTPLTRLVWWRICLDEAQMVESSTAKATEMALKLRAEHRWCVTGTPMSRGLEDIAGLMNFLKVEDRKAR